MPKQYNAQTKQFLSGSGLVRVWTRDVATGEERLRQVSHKEAARLKKLGRIVRSE